MPTAHEMGAQDVYNRWMATEQGSKAFAAIWSGIHDGHLDQDYIDVFGQQFRGSWDPWQALMVGLMHVDVCNGRFAQTRVRAAAPPERDSNREANALALSDLPGPFVASVHMEQHGADSDGTLTWTEPIEADVATEETERDAAGAVRNVYRRVLIEPRRIPLEIGATAPSRTRLHALQEGGVARWPYGQDWVTIIVPLDPREPIDRLDPNAA